MLTTGVVMEIVIIIVMVTGIVAETVNAMGKGTAIVTEIVIVIAETVKGTIGTERDGQTEMEVRGQGLIKRALQFLIPPDVRKADGTIKVYSIDTQIWLVRSTFLQSLTPNLIKLTYLWFSNDPEDTDLHAQVCLIRVRAKLCSKVDLASWYTG